MWASFRGQDINGMKIPSFCDGYSGEEMEELKLREVPGGEGSRVYL
jgi:hypothetical protein